MGKEVQVTGDLFGGCEDYDAGGRLAAFAAIREKKDEQLRDRRYSSKSRKNITDGEISPRYHRLRFHF